MENEPSGEAILCRFVRTHFADPVVVLDSDGAVLELNQAAWEHRIDLVRLFGAIAGDIEMAEFLERTRTMGHATRDIAREDAAGNLPAHFRLTGTAVDGRVVVLVRDVTRERALDEEVRHLRRVEALGLVTARLVHDFNNILTPVRVLSGHLARKLDGSELANLAQHIESAAERASALVRDVLSFARPRGGDGAVELGGVVSGLRPLLERLVGDDIELVVSLADDLDPVALDRAALEHALLNLVANARDAMPSGGRIAIVTSAEPGECLGGEPCTISLTVSDAGVGMSDDVAQRAFDEFFTTKPTGTGLGLASVRRFVTENGGAIAIDSATGRGTSVMLRFPSVARAPIEPSPAPLAAPLGGDETILIVDRAEEVRRAARIVLQANGYRVIEASSVESASRAAQGVEIDLVLVDIAAARGDGRAIVGSTRRALPSVVMSGEGVDEDEPSAVTLTKAFSEGELLRSVRAALDAPEAAASKTAARSGAERLDG